MPFVVLFAAVAIPVIFVGSAWMGALAWRILRPEVPPLLGPDEPSFRAHLAEQGVTVRVGAREIRADVRFRERHARPAYRFERGRGTGLPAGWLADMRVRCN